MPETLVPIDVAGRSIAEVAEAIAARRFPPVEQWHPSHCGSSDMRIARDGSWFHQGAPIGREALVRQFSRILRREPDGSFVLVTPGEKLSIEVELAPLVATSMVTEGAGRERRIAFGINSGDAVVLGPGHELRLQDGAPLVHVRSGLNAILARPVYYELAEVALAEDPAQPGVWSDGLFFPLQA
ncbi:DUF1285 domain-containing protein [Sphingomonas sp. BN140010]|uniref:DUF1285 domain-containing protein n=1 Tax=Sphingomonas arvum TaxID=2992113 RepID=A0ABT3JIE5_9SPHN|nr:DUF1285 domain-containing protein [Sphingomonas sp. BN140010]MCW3798724.1 DUF1285 domain-containing protein [Sphingomonas sp. BN140010]